MIKENSEEELNINTSPAPRNLENGDKIPKETLRAAWEQLPLDQRKSHLLKLVLLNHNMFTAYFKEIWLILLLVSLIVIFLSLLLFIKEKAWAISFIMFAYVIMILGSIKLFSFYKRTCQILKLPDARIYLRSARSSVNNLSDMNSPAFLISFSPAEVPCPNEPAAQNNNEHLQTSISHQRHYNQTQLLLESIKTSFSQINLEAQRLTQEEVSTIKLYLSFMRLQSLGMMGGDITFCDMWYVEESYVSYLMRKVEHYQKILDDEVGDKFDAFMKIVVYEKKEDSSEEECAICLKEFASEERIAITVCKHSYHEECLRKWMIERQVCPLCKNQCLGNEEQRIPEQENEL